MSSIAVRFPNINVENAYVASQFSQHRLFQCLAVCLPSYLAQLPPLSSTYKADLALRIALALWVITSPPAHRRRWQPPVQLALRLWLALLPLLLLYAPQHNTICPRSTALSAVFGNSIVFPLLLHLPFATHIPLALLGMATSALLVANLRNCCTELHADISLWVARVLPAYPATVACAKALIALHGCGTVVTSSLLLWCVGCLSVHAHAQPHKHQA